MSGQSEKIEQIKIEQAVRKAELASTMHTQVCSLQELANIQDTTER